MSLLASLLDGSEESTKERLERTQETADDRLDERLDPGRASIEIEEFSVTSAAVVNEGPDGEPVVVPIARFSLPESREQLDRAAAWEVVPETLRVLHEAFADEFVRHFDVQFAYDGDELFEARTVDRIAVTPETVERLNGEAGFDTTALREYVEREDDIDDEIAPVAWRDAKDYSKSSDAVVVTGAAVGFASVTIGAELGIQQQTGISDDISDTNQKVENGGIESSVTDDGSLSITSTVRLLGDGLNTLIQAPSVLQNLGVPSITIEWVTLPVGIVVAFTVIQVVRAFSF